MENVALPLYPLSRFVIERQKVDGSLQQVVTTGIYNVEGLAVDWMGRNLYWTDEVLVKANSSFWISVFFTSDINKS